MSSSARFTRVRSIILSVAMMAALLVSLPPRAESQVPGAAWTLTILHNNDGESQLINAGSGLEDFGGIARFKTAVDTFRAAAGDASLMLSSGDNFLAGPEFNHSLASGIPYFDALGMDAIGYDAVAIGNHDFDFGPDVLANFINSYPTPPPYLSSNLDFTAEANLQALVDAGTIAGSTVVEKDGQMIGIVGATTPQISFISSPRDVGINSDVAGAIQAEVDALEAAGVNKIIVISHLQDITEDLALATSLSGVDVMIAGGGDELLANPGDAVIPGEEDDVFGAYPLTAIGADGASIPVVTTPGEYKYLGVLEVGFDSDGNVVGIGTDSGPVVIDTAFAADPGVQAAVVDPVAAAIAALDATVIGTSEVILDGTRTGVRGGETNEGNLIADALWWQANELAAAFGVKAPDVALQNGGGIRNNTEIAAGEITELDTFDMVPFPNFVTILPDIPRDQFKEILENAVSDLPGGGRFAQIAGFSFSYDLFETAMEIDGETGDVTQAGTRVRDAMLDDGTVLVTDGAVVAGAPITIATIDFLARGGDQYPYRDAPFTTLGATYQQALSNYIVDALGGVISVADYPEGGEGRSVSLPQPPIEGPFTAIYDIQGSGDDSPLDGDLVEVTGYVTGVFPDLGGFFLQDGAGDGDAATSDGIFVDALDDVAVGDRAEVRGTVDEFFGETRIGDVRLIEVEASGGTVAATEVDLPVAEGASLEPYEGMLITFPEYLFVSDTFNTHRFGEVLLSSDGALVNPTNVAEPGAAANAFAALNSRRSIVIDDGSGDQFPDAVPYFADDGTLRRGDAAKDITANLSFSFGAYKLQPTGDVSFTRMNPRPALEEVGGNLTVASFNVLNFFSTIDDGDNGARGADSDAEKAAQLAKLVPAISGLGADIVGLQEIENNGAVAIGELVDALNVAYGAGTWAAATDPAYPGGLEATNAIKVAIIFKTASVTPVGATEVSEDAIFAADRPPIAQTFTAFGDTFTVVNNHFKSKSSRDAEGADLDQGDGQGAYNFRRTEQAKALLDFVDELKVSSGDDDVLVLGDFNSYPLEDPITVLNDGLDNLVTKYEEPAERYSLVFFGQEGLLDGAFATDSLYPKVTGLDIWHINADEPRVLQYNDDVVDPAERDSDFNQPVSKPDIFSSSDHDPIVLGLELVRTAPFELAYSASADRSSEATLAGSEVSGRIYPFLTPLFPEGDFVKVKFYLDGAEFHTEFLAPFDFVSGGTALANQSWDTTTVADGAHTVMATGYLADGTTASTSATFTVNNAPIAADFAIGYSASPFRTDTLALDGATVRGWIYAYVYPLFPAGFEGFDTVTFYLDGEKFHTEHLAPYDLAGGGTEKANEDLDTTTLAEGEHTVVAMANRSGKRPLMASATFTVANDTPPPPPPPPGAAQAVRFATFNASLNRFNAGDLISDLSTPDNEQAQVIAEIIQRQRPEVLLVNEFDFDADGEAARLFQKNYLSVSQNGALPINYGYAFSAESNTGIPSGFDLNNNGEVGGPDDAFGFGFFPGQFGMQVYSQHPIDFANVRTFQNFLWQDMPGALLPVDPDTGPWYSDDELAVFRLSSKSHWDVPIVIDGHTVNFLVSHPTPPVFDGPEDRNGTRNHDEIRFWADYVNEAGYIYDDAGVSGGWTGDYFVIAGDQNSDPFDGDSIPGSAQLLLDNGRVNTSTTPSSLGGVEQAALQGSSNADHLGDPAFDTADFGEGDFGPGNLRADYVLPSLNLDIIDSGVFWPESTDPLFPLVGTFPFPSSDHRMVWVDVLPGSTVLPPPAEDLIELQVLTISDWHAQLDPLFVFGEGTFGGAAELSAYFDAERANNPNTLTLTAGDAYGAAPPLSSFFDEEPAVRAMRLMGFDADTFGNHNFDGGIDGLQSLIDIANADGGEVGDSFQYVSANLTNRDDNLSGVKDYEMFNVGGVDVAVIGVTNPEAPTLVFPGNFGTIVVEEPGPAAMAARAAAAAAGADIFVLLAHMGVTGFAGADPLGPLVDLANDVNGFDLIVGDHTNVEFAGMINGQLVVENRSRGRTYARVTLTVQNGSESASLISSAAVFVDPVSEDVTPDPEIVALLDPLRDELSALLGTVIGQSTVFIPRADECGQSSGRTCESLIGDVVTDAMRATYGTDFAITNSGGLRADLTCGAASDVCPAPDGGDFDITAGTVLTVLPFGNSAVTLTVTGQELKDHLEQGVSAMPGISGRFAQVSGLCFTYDIDAAVGSRVTGAVFQAPDGTCTGGPVDLTAGSSYTLAENDFTSSGGDGYPTDIGSAATREPLDQVVADYITANTPISPSIGGRITCTASGAGVCPDSNIVDSIVRAPIVADGEVAGAATDFVINLDGSMDPSVDGRSLEAGDTIRITLPDGFTNNGFDTGAPGAPNCVPGPCNLGVMLQGWPQHPIAPPAAKYSLALEGTHTFVFTALEDLGPAGAGAPGIKQIHLIALGFTNPAAGDYDIFVEAQTGPGGAWETGTGTLTILATIAPSINVTSVFNDGTPNTIYQCTETGQATPFEYDFLLFDASGGPMSGVTLENGDLMQSGAKVGEVTITGPEGATGQAVTVAAPSFEITGPVLGASTARLTAVFTAGSLAGDYVATFSLDGGNSVTMFVEATEAPPTVELSAVLDGAGEVPGPGDDDGSGTATVSITGTKVTFSFTVANIDMPTAAHIHSGAAGVAGGVVVDLLGNGTLADNGDGTFTATGMVDIDAQLASDISATPADFYVNVHNAAFAPGAIRGNLGLGPPPPPPPPTVELTAMLDGASEYPGPGDNDGSGSATVTISGTTLTYTVTVSGIGEPTAAHIHAGAAGTAGPIAVDLVPEGAAFVVDGSGGYTLTWTQEIFPAQASEMATNFANFYVNVHTTAFASGALRGQLEAE